MADNGNAGIGLLDSYDIPPRGSSSPKTDAVDGESSKHEKPTNVSSKAGPSSKTVPSSPEKPHSGASSSRLSPSKAYALPTKKAINKLQGKSQEELLAESADLKKILSNISSENVQLKTKLRKIEEDNVKRTETEKLAVNTLLSNMKRKIQRLEEAAKEKDCLIKALQVDIKLAKHEAKIAMETTKLDTAGKRGRDAKEHSKTVTARAYLPANRAVASRPTDSATSQLTIAKSLIEENRQLKEKLHRALMISDNVDIESYENLSCEHLIAEIEGLKGEIADLKTIIEKIQGGTELSGDLTSALLLEEMERMKSNQRKLKEDILTYYEALEKREMENQVLKDELAKERSANLRSLGAIPKVLTVAKTSRGQENPPAMKTSQRTVAVRKTATESAKASSAKIKPVAAGSTAIASPKGNLPSSAANRARATATKAPKTVQNVTASPPSPIGRLISSTSSPTVVNGDTPPVNGDSPAKSQQESEKRDLSKDEKQIEEFRQNVAAKKIQKSWKKHQTEEINMAEKIQMITQNHAARVIQSGWRNHHNKQLSTEDADLEDMVTTIQAVARGQVERELGSLVVDGDGDSDPDFVLNTINLKNLDESVTTIQSVARAHHHREEILHNWNMNGNGGGGDVVVNERSPKK